jgi:hypothetical protein
LVPLISFTALLEGSTALYLGERNGVLILIGAARGQTERNDSKESVEKRF